MPPKLPGFYFDEVRGRYFPAKPDLNGVLGEREQKKRKFEVKRQEQARDLRVERNDSCLKYVSELISPIKQAFGDPGDQRFPGALTIEGSSYDECRSPGFLEQEIYDTEIEGSHLTGHMVFELSSLDGIIVVVSTVSGCILGLKRPCDCEANELSTIEREDYVEVESLGLSNSPKIILKLAGNSFKSTGLYCHMTQVDSTIHTFFQATWFATLHSNIRHRDLSAFRNVNDSANLGKTFVIAADSSLQVSRWEHYSRDDLEEFKLPRIKSDIVCLAAKSDRPSVLYAGTRDGWVHSIPISHFGSLIRSCTKSFKLPVRSIVSIKTCDSDDLIFVSAISGGTQTLLLVDTLMKPEDCVVGKFQTSFLNVTRDQELFEVSSDGRLLLYGSRAGYGGLGDFEVFSSHMSDNAVYDRGVKSVTFFPLKTLRTDFLDSAMYCSPAKIHLRCSTFMQQRTDISKASSPGILRINADLIDYFILIIVESANNIGTNESSRTPLLTWKVF